MAQRIQIAVRVLASVERDDEANVFVSRCPVLKIYSQGATKDEAKEALEEAIGLQLGACYAFDRLHQVLTRAGFTKMVGSIQTIEEGHAQYVSVTALPQRDNEYEIEVPLTLVAAAANNPEWQLSR